MPATRATGLWQHAPPGVPDRVAPSRNLIPPRGPALPTRANNFPHGFHAPASARPSRRSRVHFREGSAGEGPAPVPAPTSSYHPPTLESIDDETAGLLDRYETLFRSADADGDGFLSRYELRRVLERVAGGSQAAPLHWLAQEDVDRIFDGYDRDGNGLIDLREFTSLAQDNVFLAKELKVYKAAFDAVDAGGDGFIGPTELCGVLTALGSPLKSYDNIARLMGRYGAGAAGRLDFGGFLRLCRFERALPLDDILAYAAKKGPGARARGSGSDGSADDFDGIRGAAAAPAGEQSAVISVPSEQMLAEILRLNGDRLVVVMASLSWCRPCKRIAPAFQRLAANYGAAAVFLRLNGNDSEETKRLFKKKLRVRVTPSFLFFRGGRPLGHVTGANASRLESTLRSLLPPGDLPARNLYDLVDPELVTEEGPGPALAEESVAA